MAHFTIWMPDALMARLDEHPAAGGNLSAFLRRLIQDAVQDGKPARGLPPVRGRPVIVCVSLSDKDAARLAEEAGGFGFGRAFWLAALVGRHFRNTPRFSRPGELALVSIQMDLRRIGQAMVSIASRTSVADEETGLERGPCVDRETFAALRTEVRGHMAAIRSAFEGNLDYWAVGDE